MNESIKIYTAIDRNKNMFNTVNRYGNDWNYTLKNNDNNIILFQMSNKLINKKKFKL
jgi:hypothetical protein